MQWWRDALPRQREDHNRISYRIERGIRVERHNRRADDYRGDEEVEDDSHDHLRAHAHTREVSREEEERGDHQEQLYDESEYP